MTSEGSNKTDLKLRAFYTAVAITNDTTSDLVSLVEENVDDNVTSECCDEFLKLSLEYVTSLERLCCLFTADVDWVPAAYLDTSKESCQEVELSYADGGSPWSFWLTFQSSPQYESLVSMLQEDWQSGSVRKLNSMPNPGSFVVCVDRNNIFRAVVLSTNSSSDKIRVRNIDSTYVKVIKLDNVYFMKKKYTCVHAQTVQCCLTEDGSLRPVWNSDLNDLFRNTVKSCRFKVKFLRLLTDGSVVPKYIIKMTSSDSSNVSFDSWICCKMLPELVKYQDDIDNLVLENLPENVLDPFFVEELPRNVPDKNICFNDNSPGLDVVKAETPTSGRDNPWSSQLFLPPNPMMLYPGLGAGGSTIAAQYVTTAVFSNQRLDKNANVYSVPHQVTTTTNFIVKPSHLSSSILNADTPVFEPRKTIELKSPLQIEEKKPEVTSSVPDSNDLVGSSVDTVEVCSKYSKTGFCLTPCCTKKHIKLDVNSSLPASKTSDKTDQTDCKPESLKGSDGAASIHTNTGDITVNVDERIDGHHHDEDNYDDNDEDIDEPCVTGGYLPTDESRLCQFPSHNGTCWKKYCNKEHEDINYNKWTTDKLETKGELFNELVLPGDGETVELIVTCVVNSFTFYSRLPNIYSDIGDGTLNMETFSSLHNSINDPKNLRNYRSLPPLSSCESELCLARSSDHMWKRCRVIEDMEKSVRIFQIDYGNEEVVDVSALKILEEKFCHLPAQAVLCSLSGLYCNYQDRELRNRGKKILDSLIRGKVIVGKVVSSCNGELDLMVTCNGCNINSLMVSRGMCEQL